MKVRMMIFVALLAMSGQASSGSYYGGDGLLTLCKSNIPANRNICDGYLMGIADAAGTITEWAKLEAYFCISNSVTGEQLREVYIKYLTANLEDQDYSAHSIALTAFREAFPCQ
jgi:hypothetical protein